MGYIVIPEEVLKLNITDSSKILYIKLIKLAYNQIFSYPKITELAKELNVSESTVKRATKELREKGLIKVYRRTVRATNHYILVPFDWIDFNKEVTEEEQYIEGEEEFNNYIAKVEDYYESSGLNLVGKVKEYRPKSKTSLTSEIEEVEQKIKKKDYNFSTKDLVVLFAKFYEERYKIPYNVNWGRDMASIKEMFKSSTVQGYEAMMMIKKYIEMYDDYFKNHQYPLPMINHLKVGFVFRQVAKKVLNDIEGNYTNIDSSDIEYKGRTF